MGSGNHAAVTLLALAASLAGCAVGPDFHPPALALPDRIETVSSTATMASDVAGGAAQHLLAGRDIPGEW